MTRSYSHRGLSFEALEDRDLPAVFTVTNLNDAVVNTPGAVGTLRQAIFNANATPAIADEIVFNPALAGTIQLTSVGSQVEGSSALLVTSPITIRGNANGITMQPSAAALEMRLFHVESTGNLILESIMLTGGIARGEHGDVPGEAGSQARGGAIFNQGTLEIVASTLYGNSAIGGNGLNASGGQGIGGAIANVGGTVTVKNSTISGNSVASGFGTSSPASFGGGIHSLNGLLRIYNSTITSNVAPAGREVYVIAAAGTATLELHSSIVAQYEIMNVADIAVLPDTGGELVINASHNIIRQHLGLDGTYFINEDPLLGPLADNGGPTLTHATPAGSSAADAGTNLLGLSTDQRGITFARHIGNGPDIGAFELQAGPELPGDYNRDEFVNAADYVWWRKTMGNMVSTYEGADGNGSGEVDPGDFDVWSENFGESLSPGSGGISSDIAEPAPHGIDDDNGWMLATLGAAIAEISDRNGIDETTKLLFVEEPPLTENVHDKALLAMLLSWDSVARGERVALEST
jgi:hypothetical protein